MVEDTRYSRFLRDEDENWEPRKEKHSKRKRRGKKYAVDVKDMDDLKVNSLQIYVDGEMENSTFSANTDLRNRDDTPVRIGAGDLCWEEGPPEDVGYYFKGIIDEVAIYRKALTAEEIKKDMEGITGVAVEPVSKLATTWAKVKTW